MPRRKKGKESERGGASLSGGPDAPRRPAVLREPSLGGELRRTGQVRSGRPLTDGPTGRQPHRTQVDDEAVGSGDLSPQQCHRGFGGEEILDP